MLEQPTQEIELTAEQRRNLGHVYRMILGWRRDRKNKPVSHPVSESLPKSTHLHRPIRIPLNRQKASPEMFTGIAIGLAIFGGSILVGVIVFFLVF